MGRASIFVFITIVFAVCHTLFMRMNLPAYGPRLGTYLDDISYAMLVALILTIIFTLPSVVRKICLLIFILTIQLLVFGEWWNFEFYRDYIRYASLGHAADWREIARGIQGFEARYLAIFGLIGFLAVAFLLEAKSSILRVSSMRRVVVVVGVAFLAFIPTAVFSKHYIDTQIKYWRRSAIIPMNYKNPILQLFREKFLDKIEGGKITGAHIRNVNQLYQNSDSVYPFYRNGKDAKPKNIKNIIFVTLESIRKYETLPRNGVELTPNFNRISSGNFTPKYYYANSNQTIKAEIALFCGMHDFLVGTSLSAPNIMKVSANCLPSILKKYGYKSYWFHGAGAEFFNRDQFLPLVGFDELHDRFAIESKYNDDNKYYSVRHWGVEDPYTFDYALERLEGSKQPFLAEILTVSNHYPFIDLDGLFQKNDLHPMLPVDSDDIYNRYQHLSYYTDKALGRFWEAFKVSSLYENTIVVISGDHGIWLFPEELGENLQENATLQYETYLRLPLTIYFPGMIFDEPLNIIMSQVDVAEILMTYLGLDDARAFQSKVDSQKILEIFKTGGVQDKDVNPVFSSIGDNYYFRYDDMICYPPIQAREGCDDYLFRCEEEFNVLRTDKTCVKTNGDVLSGKYSAIKTDYETQPINAVVDYFRKSIYFGSMPGNEILGSQFSNTQEH